MKNLAFNFFNRSSIINLLIVAFYWVSSIPVDAEEIFSDRDRFVDVDELENHKDSENNLSEMVYDSSGFELQNVPVFSSTHCIRFDGRKRQFYETGKFNSDFNLFSTSKPWTLGFTLEKMLILPPEGVVIARGDWSVAIYSSKGNFRISVEHHGIESTTAWSPVKNKNWVFLSHDGYGQIKLYHNSQYLSSIRVTDEEGGISRSFLKEEIIIGSSSQPESQSSYFTGYLDQLFLVDHELETSDFEELEKRNNFFSLSWFSSIVLLFNLGEGLYPNLVDLIGGVVAFGKNNVPEDYVLIKEDSIRHF